VSQENLKVIERVYEDWLANGTFPGAEVQSARTAHVWTLREGKAVRLDLYLDRERALGAVGLSD
jgi:ketosteroid isomerase-like protein